MIFDDYRWFPTAPRLKRPGYAIDTFEYFFEDQFELLHNEGQFIIRKTGTDFAGDGLDMSRADPDALPDGAVTIMPND